MPGTTMTEKVLRWMIFSVVLALIPLLANALITVTFGASLTLTGMLEHGELLLIAAALSAAGAGELFGTSNTNKLKKITAGGGSILILLSAAIYFASISSAASMGALIDISMVSIVSIVFYVCALIASFSCVALSEI